MADHIQLPQLWMKAFKNDKKDGGSNQTYCFNFTKGIKTDGHNSIDPQSIGSIRIDSIGVEENHYHKDVEKYLSANWEIRFGELKTLLAKQIRKGLKHITLDEKDETFLQRFIAISLSRSKFFKSEVEKIEGKFFASNDIAVLSVIEEKFKMFEDFEIQFLNNKSKLNFVLPSYTFYYVSLKHCITPIVVLTPKIAIRFIPKKECPKTCSGFVIDISDDENIKNYNYSALLCEMYTNQDFVISKTKKVLDYLYNGD